MAARSEKVVLWLGPIWEKLIASAVPAPWKVTTISRGAPLANPVGSEAFRVLAGSLGNDPLTALAPGAKEIIIASFSAGHGAVEVILRETAGRNDGRIRGLLACDSYYVATGNKEPKPGFLAWSRLALDRGLPAWFTTSGFAGPNHPSASESIKPLVEALDLQPVDHRPVGMPEAEQVLGRGSIRWFDYGKRYSHKEHATMLAELGLRAGGFFGAGAVVPPPAWSPVKAEPANVPPPPKKTEETSDTATRVLGGVLFAGLVGGTLYALTRRS